MKLGTKSVLYGGHQFIIHPIFVTVSWRRLYGKFPSWKELVCIVIHDWGYWSKPNIDGVEGSGHTYWAANKVWNLFKEFQYYNLCYLHSRFVAADQGREVSKLCYADKLGVALMPTWLWVFLTRLTGEINEYLSNPHGDAAGWRSDPHGFFEDYKLYVADYLKKSKGEREGL